MKPPLWYTHGLPHIWLPYTQMKSMLPPLPVKATAGCRIILEDGRELIDGTASWWSACHGYNHPHLLAAVNKQLNTMPHVMFGGLTHEPALTLAKRMTEIVPEGLTRVFFSDSGSTSVEVALKMALQYWKNKGNIHKTKIICFRHSYHGDTMGAMSVSDPDDMHKAFRNLSPKQYVLDIPNDEYSLSEFSEMISGIHPQTAALIIEPLVQCAGGMKFHSSDVLAELYRLCKQHEILFIADEVATGFGRTGYMFACDEAGITPDILCIGKALTGGIMGMAATLATEAVFSAFYDDDPSKALMHGPTYMANALACSAALASLDLFESEPRLQQIEAIEAQLAEGLKPCRTIAGVQDVRVKGAIGVVQLDSSRMHMKWLRSRFIEEGVWVRPFRDMIYLMPPFTITREELEKLSTATVKITQEWSVKA